MDQIRKQAEFADCLDGFQLLHSMGGGTGSGLGSLILEFITDEYPEKIVQTFSVFPEDKVGDFYPNSYSATLTMRKLLEYSSNTICISNKFERVLNSNYGDLNHLITNALLGLTCPI